MAINDDDADDDAIDCQGINHDGDDDVEEDYYYLIIIIIIIITTIITLTIIIIINIRTWYVNNSIHQALKNVW